MALAKAKLDNARLVRTGARGLRAASITWSASALRYSRLTRYLLIAQMKTHLRITEKTLGPTLSLLTTHT